MLDRVSTQSVKKSSRYGMSSSVILLSLVAGVVATHGGLGCGGSLGDECSRNSDCSEAEEGLLCIFGRCLAACSSSVDCDDQEMCFKDQTNAEKKEAYCAVPESCTDTKDCISTDDEAAQNRVCSEGVCRNQCDDKTPCPEGQHCFELICYENCKGDQDCLDGEGCFDGLCAKKDPAKIGDQGNFCRVHTDCVSLNCIEHACEGCRSPVDCGGRTCLNMTPDEPSTGMCAGGEISGADEFGEAGVTVEIPTADLPFDVNEFSMNPMPETHHAILDSSALNAYFIVEWFDNNNKANYDLVTGSLNGNPNKICTLPLIPHGPISLSHDDEKLYLAGFSSKLNNGGVFQIDINPVTSSCGTPVLIPWTAGYFVQAIDVRNEEDENQMKKDALYISGTKLFGGLHAIISGDPSAPMHSTWLEVDWAAYSIAAAENQVFASLDNDFDVPSHESLFLGVIKPGFMSSFYVLNTPGIDADQFNVAFNTAEDTLYVAINDSSDSKDGYIFAINTSKQPPIVKHKLDGVSNIHRIYRARNDDSFLLTTSDNKLFRINLSPQP